MSIRIMSDIWEMPFPPTDKLVFLAIADCANDEGLAWPSIATIARKSGVSERTVQRSIRLAEKAGLIRREEVRGKGCKYHFNPRHSVTTDKVSPVTNEALTPDTVSPKPSRTIIIDKAKALPIGRVKLVDDYPMPEWADPVVWSDYMKNRKRKNKPNTATAYKRFRDDIARLSDDEWPPSRLLEHAAAEGWAGIYEPRDKENGKSKQSRNSNDGMGSTERAARQALHDLSGGKGSFADSRGEIPASDFAGSHRIIDAVPDALRSIGYAGR